MKRKVRTIGRTLWSVIRGTGQLVENIERKPNVSVAVAPLGTYFLDRDQPPLSSEEAEVVGRFHDLYYRRWLAGSADTINLSWFAMKP